MGRVPFPVEFHAVPPPRFHSDPDRGAGFFQARTVPAHEVPPVHLGARARITIITKEIKENTLKTHENLQEKNNKK
jgi:hypothetical protein